MLIGIVGKPSSGKSTFFSAATLVDVEISPRPFTTIDPNKGVTYVTTECPCKELGITCNPKNSKCISGTRLVPFNVIDVAGLVPGAHEGKGLGNQFLSELMTASAFIHVVDISGSTDENGNSVQMCSNDPVNDIEFLEKEIDYWILGILKKNFVSIAKKSEMGKETLSSLISSQLSGLLIKEEAVENALVKFPIIHESKDQELLEFVKEIREKSKPMLIAANKIDLEPNLYEKTKQRTNHVIVPCSAVAELALRKASEKKAIEYTPGDKDFRLLIVDEKQKKGLEFVKKNILEKYGSTGVQELINKAVFSVLDMIVVFPVANESKKSDIKGNVLPDAIILKKGSTPKDLAFKIHEDIGKNFIAAVDAKTGRNVSSTYELKNGDVICIKSGK